MGDVSKGEGRTVLFVSHNIAAISNLCKSSILLENGLFIAHEDTVNVINGYIKRSIRDFQQNIGSSLVLDDTLIKSISFNGQVSREIEIIQGENLIFSFNVEKDNVNEIDLLFNIELKTIEGISIGCFGNEFQKNNIKLRKGKSKIEVDLGVCNWKKGEYSLNFYFQLGTGLELNSTYKEDIILVKVNQNFFKNDNWNRFIDCPQHGFVPIKWESITKLEI